MQEQEQEQEFLSIPACRLPKEIVERLNKLVELDTPRLRDVLKEVILCGLKSFENKRLTHLKKISD